MAKIDLPEMDKMPGNSNNAGETKQAIKPTVSGKTGLRKKKKFSLERTVLNAEAPKVDIVGTVIEPGIKNLVLDIISSIADTVVDAFALNLFKDGVVPRRNRGRGRRDSSDRYKNGYIDYTSTSNKRNNGVSKWNQDIGDFSDIGFKTYNDAMDVISDMKEVISKYGRAATVADLYRLSKLSPRSSLDSNWGWDDLSGAMAVRDSLDPDLPYGLVMPEPKYLR